MGLVDNFMRGVGNAVTDIREKVVEEPLYGRALTNHAQPEPPAAPTSVSVEWGDVHQHVAAPETTPLNPDAPGTAAAPANASQAPHEPPPAAVQQPEDRPPSSRDADLEPER